MSRAVRVLLTIACALYLGGGHWAVLQMTAWTGMLVVRSQQAGLVQAVESIFSGKRPCRLCSAISDGQKDEGQREIPALTTLKEVPYVAAETIAAPPARVHGEHCWPQFCAVFSGRADAPPTPPPERA